MTVTLHSRSVLECKKGKEGRGKAQKLGLL